MVIFLVTESEYDYDSAHHRNVKAFEKYIDAETLRFQLHTAQERKNELSDQVRKAFMDGWAAENPQPQPELLKVSMPRWNQKNGKKKTADPAILAAFEAEEERVMSIAREHSLKHAAVYNEWETRAIAATRTLLVELGMSEEDAATVDTTGTYLQQTYYDYEVEEVEFE